MAMTMFPEIGNILKPYATPLTERGLVTMKVDTIIAAVCETWCVERGELLSDRQSYEYSRPRQAAYLLTKTYTPYSLPVIGLRFNRDHTTVMYGIRKARELIETNPKFAALFAQAEAIIKRTVPHD